MFAKFNKLPVLVALLSLSAVTFLAACTTPLNSDAAASIHTIAIIPADDPGVGVNPINGIAGLEGVAGGLIGMLLAPGGGAEQSRDLSAKMKGKDLFVGREFTSQIRMALIKNGYNVIVLENVKHTKKGKLLEDCNNIGVSADAILDINVPIAGYYDRAMSSYYPTLALTARLVDGKSKEELFYDNFSYGGLPSLNSNRVVEADSKYAVWDRNDIAKDPDKALEGFRVGISSLVELLRKKLVK